MGVDAGFDMVPRLSKELVDRHNWDQFINFTKDYYKDDIQVEIKPNYILFKAGEHPRLPFEGHKFLRFCSCVSGQIAASTGVASYIDSVATIAEGYFGSRVQYWHEAGIHLGKYDWKEVRESFRSYEQPDEPEIHTSIPSPLGDIDPIKELGIPLFEIKDIPGQGRGLIARFNIPKGTQILCEEPLLTVPSLPPNELELILAEKLKALPRASQRQFVSLHNKCPGKHPFGNTFRKNALPCGPGSVVGGVYPTICLINHSCIPNSHHSWDDNAEHETIYAIRPIKVGEEVTISFLKGAFDFDCKCRGCSRPPSELQASDARRRLIQSLDDAIGDPFRMISSPEESLRGCHSLLRVLEEEYEGSAGMLNARLYYDAFQVSIAHGDQARASVFVERAYTARVICEGEDSPETQRVKSLALKPANHSSYGQCSMRWKTTRDMISKELDTAQFEEWLFRKAKGKSTSGKGVQVPFSTQ